MYELPPNRWFDAGDERFRPGNILVSARNLNAIFIIDKTSGEVVWRYSDGLDYQHEAIMVERDLEKAARFADRLLIMNKGSIVLDGPAKETAASPGLKDYGLVPVRYTTAAFWFGRDAQQRSCLVT